MRNSKLLWVGYCIALGMLLFPCIPTHAAPSASQTDLTSANTDFAFNLLQQLVKEQPGTTIFVSPFGASSVLQMACNGAAGQTKAEIQQVLGTTGLYSESINEAYGRIGTLLNSRGTNIILTAANALWYREGTQIKPEFVEPIERFFGATVGGLDFESLRSVDIINTWASEKTRGRITHIAEGLINRQTEFLLANAVYFKGKWDQPFDVKLTKQRVFHLRGRREKKVPMMEQSRRFTYRRGTGYQAARLEYQGWSLGMYVFLPDVNSSPEKLLGIMNGSTWRRVTEPGFSQREGKVVMPKFKIEYGVELKQPLKSLGMRAAFGKADFSGISVQPLSVSAVQQQAFIEVNEEGTEAVAATAMTFPSGIETEPPKPFEMIVDRPFLFLIEDKETKTILFVGVVFDP